MEIKPKNTSQTDEGPTGSQGRRLNIDYGLATSFNPYQQPINITQQINSEVNEGAPSQTQPNNN